MSDKALFCPEYLPNDELNKNPNEKIASDRFHENKKTEKSDNLLENYKEK